MSANQEHQILTECRDYVQAHGNDLELPDYYRLQAAIWDILGTDPYMGHVDEVIYRLEAEADVDRGDWLPEGYKVSDPEHGPAVSRWKDWNDMDIRSLLAALTWKGSYS